MPIEAEKRVASLAYEISSSKRIGGLCDESTKERDEHVKELELKKKIINLCQPENTCVLNQPEKASVESESSEKASVESESHYEPDVFTSVEEAMAAFMHVLDSAKESLRKIILQWEFYEYPEVKEMHGSGRLEEMIREFSQELPFEKFDYDGSEKFLMEEIRVLEEATSMGLPNFFPKIAFLTLLRRKVEAVSVKPVKFMEKAWGYIENVVTSVVLKKFENYPQILSSMRRVVRNLIAQKKEKSIVGVNHMIEKEKICDYTCDPKYVTRWKSLMALKSEFDLYIQQRMYSALSMDCFGYVDLNHLVGFKGPVQEAFDVKMRMKAYWDIVTRRMVDNVVLDLILSVHKLVNEEVTTEIVNELVGVHGNGLEKMMQESPSIAGKRSKRTKLEKSEIAGKRIKLEKSIKLLKESKDVVAKIVDDEVIE